MTGMTVQALLLTLVVGVVCGYIGYRTRIPGGPLIGALIGVAALNIFTGNAMSLKAYKIAAQTIAGLFIGMQLGKCSFRRMLGLWKPILVVVLGMLIINATAAFLVYISSPMDVATAIFATTPGGIAEMSVMAGDMNANTLYVSVLQFARLLFSLAVFPTVAGKLIARLPAQEEDAAGVYTQADIRYTLPGTLLVVALAAVCGIAGYYSGISGAMLFLPMLCVALLGQRGLHAKVHFNFKRVAQVLSGICIGAGITRADVLGLRELILPLVLLLVAYFVLCNLLGYVLYRVCRLSASAAFFSCIPAGVSDMALIASDFGNGAPVVAILQLCRFASVVFLTPMLVTFLMQCMT